MKRKQLIFLAFIIAILAGVVIYSFIAFQGKTSVVSVVSTSTDVISATSTESKSGTTTEEFVLDDLHPGDTISSPLTLHGFARGWYFEGSFPVRLLDANGAILWQGPAQAQSDWMTSSPVPFSVTITFARPKTASGTLIFKNDNPSGDPARDRIVAIPIVFGNQDTRAVDLYYYNPELDKDAQGNIMCSKKGLVRVMRSIPKSTTPLTDTLNLFFKGGLTDEEKGNGIVTEFPLPGVALQSASLSSSGDLKLSIADPNHKLSGGSCRVMILRSELEATIQQFPSVRSISYDTDLFQP